MAFVLSTMLPLGLALYADLKLRGKAKGTTLNFIALAIFLFLSSVLDGLYTSIRFGLAFNRMLLPLIFRMFFLVLAVLGVFGFNHICQCKSKITQVFVSLIIFDIIWAISYGVYAAVGGYSLIICDELPLISSVTCFRYASGIGEVLSGLAVLTGEVFIIYPYALIGEGDANENYVPKVKTVKHHETLATDSHNYDDQIGAIKKYKELLDKGIISEEEYEAKKKDILG